MNTLKFQGTKLIYIILLYFYPLIKIYQKQILRKQSHLQLHQKNKISRNKFNHGMVVVVQLITHVQLFTIPWTIAHQDPLSMGFSGQEYWSRLPFPSPRELPGFPWIKPGSPALNLDPLPTESSGIGKTYILKTIRCDGSS